MRVRPFIVFAFSILVSLVLLNVFKFKPGDTCDFYPCDYSNVKYYNKKMLLDCAVDVVPIPRNEDSDNTPLGTPEDWIKSIGPNKTFWVYFYGDSVLRDMFVDLLSLVNNTQLTEAPAEDCVANATIKGKAKCVCWDYTLPLYRFDLAPSNQTAEYRRRHKPPPVSFIRITYRAKHKIYEPGLDEEILRFENGCNANMSQVNITHADEDLGGDPRKVIRDTTVEGTATRTGGLGPTATTKNITRPNFLLLNSGLWDILYERNIDVYKKGAVELLKLLKEINAKPKDDDPEDDTTTTTTTHTTSTFTTSTTSSTTSSTTGTPPTLNTTTNGTTTDQEDEQDDGDDKEEEEEVVAPTRIMFVGAPAVVAEKLATWKRPFLANWEIQMYNDFILQLMKDNGIKVLDTFKITHANEDLTTDGIHFPGIVSRTNTNLALKSLCP